MAWPGGLRWHVIGHEAARRGVARHGLQAARRRLRGAGRPLRRPRRRTRKTAAKIIAASQQVKRGNEETRNAGTQERRNAGTQERRNAGCRHRESNPGRLLEQPRAKTTILRATRTMKNTREAGYIVEFGWKTARPWSADCMGSGVPVSVSGPGCFLGFGGEIV